MPREWDEEKLKEMVEKYEAVTVPVMVSVEARQKVLDVESVKKILSHANIISLADCYCRKTLQNCDKPLEVCLSLDKEAVLAINEGIARRIALEEALKVLEMSHKAGLVHLAYTVKGEGECCVICSCCSCCCHHMAALTRFGYHDVIVKSNFVSQIEKSLCSNCGLCVERCQFGAWTWSDSMVEFHAERCFGCGLCVTSCPSGAITLVER